MRANESNRTHPKRKKSRKQSCNNKASVRKRRWYRRGDKQRCRLVGSFAEYGALERTANSVGSRSARSPTRTARLNVGAWEPGDATSSCVLYMFSTTRRTPEFATTQNSHPKKKKVKRTETTRWRRCDYSSACNKRENKIDRVLAAILARLFASPTSSGCRVEPERK